MGSEERATEGLYRKSDCAIVIAHIGDSAFSPLGNLGDQDWTIEIGPPRPSTRQTRLERVLRTSMSSMQQMGLRRSMSPASSRSQRPERRAGLWLVANGQNTARAQAVAHTNVHTLRSCEQRMSDSEPPSQFQKTFVGDSDGRWHSEYISIVLSFDDELSVSLFVGVW